MWVRFEDKLPTEKEMNQVKILFCCPRWATFERGLYTHKSDEDLRERLARYDIQTDSYYDWKSMLPTHWMLEPNKPTNTLFQVGEEVWYIGEKFIIYHIEIREHGSADYWLRHCKDSSVCMAEESFIEKVK